MQTHIALTPLLFRYCSDNDSANSANSVSLQLALKYAGRFQEHLPIPMHSHPPHHQPRFCFLFIAFNQKLGGSCGKKNAVALVKVFIFLPCRSSLPSYHPCCSSTCKHHTVPCNTTTIKHACTQTIQLGCQLMSELRVSLGVQSLYVPPVLSPCSSSDYYCLHVLCLLLLT